MLKLEILCNDGKKKHTEKTLNRNSRFLRFFYRLKPLDYSETEKAFKDKDMLDRFLKKAKVLIARSCEFDEDLCTLKRDNRSVFFLLSSDLDKNMDFFKRAYLPKLPEFKVVEEDYDIERLSLLSLKDMSYRTVVSLAKKRRFDNPADYWKEAVEKIPQDDIIKLWASLNSLYRQFRRSTKLRIDPALTYLEVTQENIQALGTPHLDYAGHVMTSARFPLKQGVLDVRDPVIEDKEIKPYSFVPDIRQALFFNPSFHWEFVKSYEKDNRLTVNKSSDSFLGYDIK